MAVYMFSGLNNFLRTHKSEYVSANDAMNICQYTLTSTLPLAVLA